MVRFEIRECRSLADPGLVYRSDELSIDALHPPEGGVTSVLLDSFQLEIDQRGRVLYPWGLLPHPGTWGETEKVPPPSAKGDVVASVPEVIPGISVDVDPGRKWTVSLNRQRAWLCIGEPAVGSPVSSVQFAVGCVLVLDGDVLLGLWLCPQGMPGGCTA